MLGTVGCSILRPRRPRRRLSPIECCVARTQYYQRRLRRHRTVPYVNRNGKESRTAALNVRAPFGMARLLFPGALGRKMLRRVVKKALRDVLDVLILAETGVKLRTRQLILAQ